MKKKFSTLVVLSASHGKLLCDIGDIYNILNWMLDENLFTHQLPRASKFCAPFLRAQFPQIEDWDIHNAQVNTENVKDYQKKAVEMFGEMLAVEKPPRSVWTEKHPLQELEEMVGKEKIIVVEHP